MLQVLVAIGTIFLCFSIRGTGGWVCKNVCQSLFWTFYGNVSIYDVPGTRLANKQIGRYLRMRDWCTTSTLLGVRDRKSAVLMFRYIYNISLVFIISLTNWNLLLYCCFFVGIFVRFLIQTCKFFYSCEFYWFMFFWVVGSMLCFLLKELKWRRKNYISRNVNFWQVCLVEDSCMERWQENFKLWWQPFRGSTRVKWNLWNENDGLVWNVIGVCNQ